MKPFLKSLQLAGLLFLLIGWQTIQAQTAAQKVIEATEKNQLHHLYVEQSAKWEMFGEQVIRFNQRQPEKSQFLDSARVVRLMGFSKRGEPIYYQTFNLDAARSINTHRLWTGGFSELNLNGEGITLNLWDGGSIRATHQEFGGRTTQMDGTPIMNGHATHVAGTMVAAGMVPTAKGMAPAANLHVYDFGNDEEEMIQAAASGALLSNHSYGRPTGWLFQTNQWWWYGDTRISSTIDYKFGYYGDETRVRDEITYLAPFYLQVHASGNDRLDTGPIPGEEHNVFDHDLGIWVKSTDPRERDGGEDGFDSTTGLVIGKNVLTVGSVADVVEYIGPESVILSEFSSMGPADDGRIKPDVVANGQSLLSTWVDNNNSYEGRTGTSMAAPTITGSLGLLQQLNSRLFGSYLRAATIKALVIHTTREAGQHPGPDYRHGWGLADIEAAARIIPEKGNNTLIEERNLVQNTVPTYTKTVYATGQQPLVVTLAWSDVPGTPLEPSLNNRTPLLVNDLDVRLTRISDGQVFYPWKLDPDNPAAAATQGDNLVDNVEKIQLLAPEPGQYQIVVSHKGTIVDPVNATNKRQAFSLVVSGIAERATDLAITNAYVLGSGCDLGVNTPAIIVVENKGQQNASNIPVSYIVKNAEGLTVDSGVIELPELAAGLSAEMELEINLSQGLAFEFIATVNYPGDQLPSNNTFIREIISENWIVSEESYHTSFEGILYLEDIGWTPINANNDEAGWNLRIATAPSQWSSDGSNSARYGVFNTSGELEVPQQADDWLVSTCMYLQTGETYRLSFDYRSWNSDTPGSMKIMMGFGSSPEDLDIELLDLGSFAMDAYTSDQVQFTVPVNGTYYFAFHVYSPPGHYFIYLDNITLERMVFADIAATDIVVEAEGCEFTDETPVTATLTNLGMEAQSDFAVELLVTHLPSQTQQVIPYTFSQTLQPDESFSVELLADMSLNGKYSVKLVTLLEGDERPENDTLNITINNTSQNLAEDNYFTDFNGFSGLEEMGWSAWSGTTDGTGWRYYSVPGQSYSPPNSLNMYRAGEDPDEWAFSNCLKLEEGEFYRVKFFTATQGSDSEEMFSVHLMQEPSPDGSLMLLGNVWVNTVDYVREEFVFQAPYTGNFHIGFYTDFVGPNTFQIFVDDFTVESLLDHDAEVHSIIQTTWGCNAFDTETPVKVVIENKGKEPLINALVELSVEAEPGILINYSLNSTKTLTTTERDTLIFQADFSQLNTIFTLTAEVVLDEDQDLTNNLKSRFIRNTTVDLTAGQVYFNDFELETIDGTSAQVDPASGWWFENTNNDFDTQGNPISWIIRKYAPFAYSGEVSMRSGRSLEVAADDWLFSNCLIMQAGESYLLTFYYTGRTTSNEEKMSVYYGTGQTSADMENFLWSKTFKLGLNYQKAVVAFSPPEDGIYYIGFQAESEPNQGWIYLDDFKIMKNHDVDISLDEIEVLAETCDFSEETPVRIYFRNSGNQDIDHPLVISYQILNPAGQPAGAGELTFDQPLASNETQYVDIVADLRQYGIYTINASVSLSEGLSEPETGNNAKTLEVLSSSLNPEAGDLYLTFEQFERFDQTGWTVHDVNNDGFTWDLGVNYTTYSFSGNRVMYYSFSSLNNANDWLFSGCANLQAGSVYNVGFYYRVYDGDYPEKMSFGIASEPHPDALIEFFEVHEELVNYNYRRVIYAFSVEEDGQYFFAWHAQSPKYQRFLFVDDFSLRKASQVDGMVHNVLANAEGCGFSEETPVILTLSNLGNQPLPEGSLQLNIQGPDGNQSLSIPTPAIDVLGMTDVNITAPMNLHGKYTVGYNLQVEGDQQPANNTGSRNLFNTRLDLDQPGKWYIQDFETIFALREIGWKIFNLNNDNRYWGLRVNDPPLAHSGHNYLIYFTGNTTQAANDWLISGCYMLEPGRKYTAGFFYRLGSGTHRMRLATGMEPVPTAMDNIIWEATNLVPPDHSDYIPVSGVFEPTLPGPYYFGIHQFSLAGQGSSILDDLVVIAQPEILPIEEIIDFGQEITIHALASDSLRWFADAALTQEIGTGTSLTLTANYNAHFSIFAAEYVYGIMGPADSITVQMSVGIDQLLTAGKLNIYPNPAKTDLTILTGDQFSGNLFIEVFNAMGDRVLATTMHEAGNGLNLNIAGLPLGTYMIRITDGKHLALGRFVKL
ncbi:MAG: choice-of-anchor J domain-containing protein [Bacteroidales bacterium]|nr:choice-of-anchor J domain-containing protein [Bacteroidales bacterium]